MTDYLWKDILTKQKLARIIENYAQVVEKEDPDTKKKTYTQVFPRYHQLDEMCIRDSIGTYIWVLSNKKEERRKGKIQLIDATTMKSTLRKNMGEKNCELTPELRDEIMRIFMEMEESSVSRVFDNREFAYWSITVERPLRLRVYPDRTIPADTFKKAEELEQVQKAIRSAVSYTHLLRKAWYIFGSQGGDDNGKRTAQGAV